MKPNTRAKAKQQLQEGENVICPLCDKIVAEGQDGILCEGVCTTWYHADCMGMLPDHFHSLVEKEENFKKWFCPHCDETPYQPHDLGDMSEVLSRALEDLEIDGSCISNLAEFNEPTEQILTVTAQIGSSLLQKNIDLQKENSILKLSLTNLEAKLEDVLEENKKLLDNQEKLQSALNAKDIQIQNEKVRFGNLRISFEENDADQENLIQQLESKILSLESETHMINNYCVEAPPCDNVAQESTSISLKDMSLHVDFTWLKKTCMQLQENVSNLQNDVHKIKRSLFVGNTPESKKQNIPATEESRQVGNTVETLNKTSSLKFDKSPPMFAILKGKEESIEDFFNKNITEFLKRQESAKPCFPQLQEPDLKVVTTHDKTTHPVSATDDVIIISNDDSTVTLPSFLDLGQNRKSRWKKTPEQERRHLKNSQQIKQRT